MKTYIIGIAGEKGVGKDTVAGMINYLFYKGITQSSYMDYVKSKRTILNSFNDRITHFADPLKDCLSIIFGIERKLFDSREHKDDLWYSIGEKRFITENDYYNKRHFKVTIDMLKDSSLSDYINNQGKYVIIKLRTLMQYFGTNIVRDQLGYKTWINATIIKAATIAETRRLCIIPDVRYSDENEAITKHFLYGGDIMVSRDVGDLDNHSSEVIDFKCKFNIDNSGTKTALFYKVREIVEEIINS